MERGQYRMNTGRVHCGYTYDGEEFDPITWDPSTHDIVLEYSNDDPQIVHGVECNGVQPFNEETQFTPIKNILEKNRNCRGIFFAENKMFILHDNGICSVYSGSAESGPKETWEYELYDAE